MGLVSPPHFVCGFIKKMFFMLYSLIWPNFITWSPLFLKIFGNTCVRTVFLPDCDVINFIINLIFLIKPFCYKTKKSKQKLKYLENEKSFWGEIKSIFCQKLSETKECIFKSRTCAKILIICKNRFQYMIKKRKKNAG